MAAAGAAAAAVGVGAGSGKLSPLAEAVGVAAAPMAVVDSRSFFVTGDTKQPKGEGAIAAVKAKNPNVLFAIARSKNINIVVYEALLDPKQPTRLHAANAVDVYWLDLDASYAVEARKKGVPHDREDLNWVEKKMAYGATATERKGKGQAGTFDLALVAVPGRAIVLAIDPKANRPRAYITLKAAGKDVECVLERIFVHTIDGWTGPDVDWYEIVGTAVADGKEVVEKIVRK